MFRGVIAAARAHSGRGKPFDQALSDYLAAWTERDILAYQQRFDEVHAALYRWDMCGPPPTSSGAAVPTMASSTSGPGSSRRATPGMRWRWLPRTAWPAIPLSPRTAPG